VVDPQLLEGFRAGDRRALARLITLLDNNPDGHRVLDELGPAANRAGVIGVTGAPGVGKSTLLGRLIGAFRARGRRVAVLAVDPQSPISGGALLGDRIRMAEPAARDEDVFIRSLSSRGVAGGLSASVRWITRLLERFGYDIILVETVGVGQDEVDVARLADVTVVVLVPGMGDDVQALKAGIMEIADVFLVNKADQPGASRLERELKAAIGLAARPDGWTPPIVPTVASEGKGIDEALAAIQSFRDSGLRKDRAAGTWALRLREMLRERLMERLPAGEIEAAGREVAARTRDPYTIVDDWLKRI
jgi:LAO/AO transport system kinase